MINQGIITQEKDGYQVVFERVLDHPIEKVWEAITRPEQMRFWFTDIQLDLQPGGKMAIIFRDDAKTVTYGQVVTLEPPFRFAWTWENELAEWELQKLSASKTKLTFTYSRLPEDYAVNAPSGFHTLLDRLEESLSGSEKIYPFGTEEKDPEHIKMKVHYAAGVYDRYPHAVKNQPVVVEKLLDAQVTRVWNAMTDKNQMKEWYFNLDRFELKEGFEFRFPGQGHKGEQYMHICTITDVQPERRLQYSWQYEGLPGFSLVTFDLDPRGEQTLVRVSHHGLETFPQDNADFARGSFNEGWNHILGISLPEFLAKTPQHSIK